MAASESIPNLSSDEMNGAAQGGRQPRLRFEVFPLPEVQNQPRTESLCSGIQLVSTVQSAPSRYYRVAKRTVDLILSSVLLLMFAPLLLLIAIVVRLDSPGPSLFVQKRVGRNGRLFDIYKFRSMYADAPVYDFSPARSCDPRITRIGRFLRRSSLDELPQLMNVFLGSMSLVGPRPEMPFIVQRYNSQHRQRLQVIPGITGVWQLSADRAFPIHQNIHHDLYYIRNRNFLMDLSILIRTLFFAMHRGV